MWRIGFVCLLAMAAVSCDGSRSREVGIVRGRVTFQSQPLAGGIIVFSPHPDRGFATVAPATAEIDQFGEYKLKVEGNVYIASGWYRVSIADPPNWTVVVPSNSPQLAAVSLFPDALRQPDKSGLEREVRAGRDNEFDFHIEVR
jgi:hypothetical protein